MLANCRKHSDVNIENDSGPFEAINVGGDNANDTNILSVAFLSLTHMAIGRYMLHFELLQAVSRIIRITLIA